MAIISCCTFRVNTRKAEVRFCLGPVAHNPSEEAMKSLWQEHVDNTNFTVLNIDATTTALRSWRACCEHVGPGDLKFYEQQGLRVFEQTGRGVVCQYCAAKHVRALNRGYRRLYTAETHGEYDSVETLEAAILRLWDEGSLEKGFGLHLDQVKWMREPEEDKMSFGLCCFRREQIQEKLGHERDRLNGKFTQPPAMRYRVFRYVGGYARWDIQIVGLTEGEQFEETQIYADICLGWEMIDATSGLLRAVAPRSYMLERIANPCGHKVPWLVLQGTKIGMAETSWLAQRPGRLNEDPCAENFGKPMPTGPHDIEMCYVGDLPQMVIVSK